MTELASKPAGTYLPSYMAHAYHRTRWSSIALVSLRRPESDITQIAICADN